MDDDYSLTVNLRRLHQLQLNKALANDSLFADLAGLLENFNNLEDEVWVLFSMLTLQGDKNALCIMHLCRCIIFYHFFYIVCAYCRLYS